MIEPFGIKVFSYCYDVFENKISYINFRQTILRYFMGNCVYTKITFRTIPI